MDAHFFFSTQETILQSTSTLAFTFVGFKWRSIRDGPPGRERRSLPSIWSDERN
jgi:hypothetical protein